MKIENTGSKNLITEINVEVKLSDLQADPNSPLYSAKNFEELNIRQDLLDGIYAMGFKRPSKIQERALPLLLGTATGKPENVIAQSQSGTGKTAAYALTMLFFSDPRQHETQSICVSPTRELANQIEDVVKSMGRFTKVDVFHVKKQEKDKPFETGFGHIVIGTPGSIQREILQKRLSTKYVKVFVLDEADEIIRQQGLQAQCLSIKQTLPPTCQIVLFSATYADDVQRFAKQMVPNHNFLSVKKEELNVKAIKQYYIQCSRDEKIQILSAIYGILPVASSIIFCNLKEISKIVADRMKREGHSVSLLHGDMEPSERDDVMERFRKRETKVLISTNVISRGIDVEAVTMVINYDVPLTQDRRPDFETYLHRIGRTGRFGKTGCAINLVDSDDQFRNIIEIKQNYNIEMKPLPKEIDQLEIGLEELKPLTRK